MKRNIDRQEVEDKRAAALLGCSVRWAYELARADLDALQAEKQAKVFRALAQGKSNVQAAKEAGVHEKSVRRWTGSAKLKGAKTPSSARIAA